MAATNRKMGVRFRFKTETTQRVYPLLEIMLKLITKLLLKLITEFRDY